MFISTINGEKYSIKSSTRDETVIKQELHQKYGFDIDKLFLHWNGYKYIVGFFNDRVADNVVNDIVFYKEPQKKEASSDFNDIFLNKKNLTDEEKELICKNLDKIIEDIFGKFILRP